MRPLAALLLLALLPGLGAVRKKRKRRVPGSMAVPQTVPELVDRPAGCDTELCWAAADLQAAADVAAPGGTEAALGLDRVVALHLRPSSSYQIREGIRYLHF
jgi:hypothetical protein